ncbi:DUF4242 domain-containing protein [uncultured Sphaerotilus sp.]|uniref:DUF4242 domain-containing protein n=1 Tax=uncultured Sphaerotilus sp. TaxID=474984 RepID=UPI0030CA51B5
MPLFLIERQFAERLDMDADGMAGLQQINAEVGVHWLYSFLSADQRKTYCLYEAGSPDKILEAARRAGLPADVIVEVSQVRPEAVRPPAG